MQSQNVFLYPLSNKTPHLKRAQNRTKTCSDFGFLCLLLTFCFASTVSSQAAPGRNQVDIGVIRSTGTQASVLGVSLFRPKTAADAVLPGGIFRETIYRNTVPSGVFRRPGNDNNVESGFNTWLKSGRSNFADLAQAGVEIACFGFYSVQGNALTADVYVYDVATGTRIFGNSYSGYTKDEAKRLARRVADDLLRYVGHEEGISDTLIAFVSNRTGKKELWVMQADGSNQVQITQENSLVTAPTFGARAGELYYTSYRQYNPDLYGILLDRSKAWAISTYPGSNMSPDWNEKRGRMALVLMKDGNSEIYTCDRAGRSMQRLTRHRAIDASPTWSPDGSKIAFVSSRLGTPQVFTMRPDGSGVRRITFQGRYNTAPAWSPDGTQLAYVGRKSGRHHIFVLDLVSNRVRQLTRGSHNNEDPTWAPNGEYIAFSSNRGGSTQVYRMRTDGSQVTPLTNRGTNHSPAWSPVLR
jgi:TolB protein